MRKLLALIMLGALNFVDAQGYLELNKILHRLEQENKINHDTEAYYDLAGKKFIFQKEEGNKSERRVLEIANEGNEARIIVLEKDKNTQQLDSKIYTGDFVRTKHIVSVRADKLEKQRIGVPLTHLFHITIAGGVWYLIDANTNERWIDTNDLDKTPKTIENLSKRQQKMLERVKRYQNRRR